MPDNDVRGTTESWWQLQGPLGLVGSLAHLTSVDEDSHKSDSNCLGIDVERLPMVMASGEKFSTGQTIVLKVKSMGNTIADVPRRATIFSHFENSVDA